MNEKDLKELFDKLIDFATLPLSRDALFRAIYNMSFPLRNNLTNLRNTTFISKLLPIKSKKRVFLQP